MKNIIIMAVCVITIAFCIGVFVSDLFISSVTLHCSMCAADYAADSLTAMSGNNSMVYVCHACMQNFF